MGHVRLPTTQRGLEGGPQPSTKVCDELRPSFRKPLHPPPPPPHPPSVPMPPAQPIDCIKYMPLEQVWRGVKLTALPRSHG